MIFCGILFRTWLISLYARRWSDHDHMVVFLGHEYKMFTVWTFEILEVVEVAVKIKEAELISTENKYIFIILISHRMGVIPPTHPAEKTSIQNTYHHY